VAEKESEDQAPSAGKGIRDLVGRALEWLADVVAPVPVPVPAPVSRRRVHSVFN
jgi:hypothetical protein